MNRTIIAATLSIASLFAPVAAHADARYQDRDRDDRGRVEIRHDGDRDRVVAQPAVTAPVVVARPVYAQPVVTEPAYAQPTYATPVYETPATTVVAQPPVVVRHVDRDRRGEHDARRGMPMRRVQSNRTRFEHGRR